MLNPDEKSEGQAEISLLLTGTEADREFIQFGKELSRLAPEVNLVRTDDDTPRPPRFKIRENLTYRAVPAGRELEIFLELIGKEEPGTKQFSGLEKIDIPVFLRLYITNSCPHCPMAVENISRLALESSRIHLEIIDGELFSGEAEAESVMSVPTLIMDEGFRWTGSIQPEEVIQFILDRDPSKLSMTTLKSMLEEGNASEVAGMMMERQVIFPAFLDLLTHPMWSVRLGAMVVIEEMAQAAPETAITLAEPLRQHFKDADHGVRGDILYILGEIGDLSTMEWLREVQAGDLHEELKEAAQDAILTISQKD